MGLVYNPAVEAEAARQGVPLPHYGERLAGDLGVSLYVYHQETLAEIYTAAELQAQIDGRERQIAERRRCLAAKGQSDDEIVAGFLADIDRLAAGLAEHAAAGTGPTRRIAA